MTNFTEIGQEMWQQQEPIYLRLQVQCDWHHYYMAFCKEHLTEFQENSREALVENNR
jgi:hypothetical protein